MPSPYAHYLCGIKMLEMPAAKHIKTLISKYMHVFNLGTQGPDILFYYRVWPWTDSLGIEKVGNIMHGERVGDFFENALEFAAHSGEEEKNILLAYLCGYACHYSLDYHTHPYIFYKTGFVRSGEKETNKYTFYHRQFETAIDVLMLKYVLNKKPSTLKLHELIRVGKDEGLAIGGLYESALSRVYNVKVSSEQVRRAISDMSAVQRVLKDKSGLKKKLLSWVETKLGRYPLMGSMVYPAAINDNIDYLNLKHLPWSLPWDESKIFTADFIEMFNTAVQEASVLSESILLYLSGKQDLEATLTCLGSRSFSTGLDCSLKSEFRYFDCVY